MPNFNKLAVLRKHCIKGQQTSVQCLLCKQRTQRLQLYLTAALPWLDFGYKHAASTASAFLNLGVSLQQFPNQETFSAAIRHTLPGNAAVECCLYWLLLLPRQEVRRMHRKTQTSAGFNVDKSLRHL